MKEACLCPNLVRSGAAVLWRSSLRHLFLRQGGFAEGSRFSFGPTFFCLVFPPS